MYLLFTCSISYLSLPNSCIWIFLVKYKNIGFFPQCNFYCAIPLRHFSTPLILPNSFLSFIIFLIFHLLFCILLFHSQCAPTLPYPSILFPIFFSPCGPFSPFLSHQSLSFPSHSPSQPSFSLSSIPILPVP